MRSITVVAAVAVFLASSVPAVAAEMIPNEFTSGADGGVIWVAASEAITAEGTVRPDLLRSGERDELSRRREYLRQRRARGAPEHPEAQGCDASFVGYSHFAGGWAVSSLNELSEAAASREVISGVVTATAVGFHQGAPHTIVQIRTEPAAAAGRYVYLLYPSGRLQFEGMTVCNHHPEFAPPPSAGEPIVFVAASRPSDSTATLYRTDGSWILYERAGSVVAGLTLKDDPLLKVRRSLETVRPLIRNNRDQLVR